MPNQVMVVFEPGQEGPRLMLGRESLALQGFPIKILETMDETGKIWNENTLMSLAGNMVSTPVMLCAVMCTMAAMPWTEIPEPVPDAVLPDCVMKE